MSWQLARCVWTDTVELKVVRLIDEPTRERLERQLAELQSRLRGDEP